MKDADGDESHMKISFLLPHELLWAMLQWNRSPKARQKLLGWRFGLRRDLQDRMAEELANLDLLEEDVVSLGISVDGVPAKFDPSESLECFSLSFPHLETSAAEKHIRLPLTILNKNTFLEVGRDKSPHHEGLLLEPACLPAGMLPLV